MPSKTAEVVETQLTAMGAKNLFEVGVLTPATASRPAYMDLRTWNPDRVMASLPWLRYRNLNGCHIYVRPQGEHDMSLVDDLKKDAIVRMKADGFQPATVVETSPGNYQAWLKHGQKLPTDLSTMTARKLAERYGGDHLAADWRHFGRLAGFTNRKGKYQAADGRYPWVRLIESTGKQYDQAPQFVEGLRRELALAKDLAVQRAERMRSVRTLPISKSINDFRNSSAYQGDLHRADIAYARYALGRGAEREDIAAAIRTRDLGKKGNERQQEVYIKRTIERAAEGLVITKAPQLRRAM